MGAVTTVEGIGTEDVMNVNLTSCVMEARELIALSQKKGVQSRAMYEK